MIYWFTGQPSAGKTTLGKLLSESINNSILIDGDELREVLDNKDYSKEGRIKNIIAAQNIAHFLDNKGFNPIVCLVSPYRNVRDSFKSKMGNKIIEIWVHTQNKRERDEYKVSDYEQPLERFIELDTTDEDIELTIKKLVNEIRTLHR